MEAKAKQSNIKMPARKIRRVINVVRGKDVNEASRILRFMPYAAARVVEKNLKDAIANASQKGLAADTLFVSEIFADEGITYKRARCRAQGRMYRRLKRTSHLTIKLAMVEK
ncbi:MAG: 50S ribosomal protein L22 [Candidatus Gastranaerophilales bacterium]|nr:50S ribosomal protein L22 [Candidatus Gastranaerophilales bacterium]